jgi:hypothetical protein
MLENRNANTTLFGQFYGNKHWSRERHDWHQPNHMVLVYHHKMWNRFNTKVLRHGENVCNDMLQVIASLYKDAINVSPTTQSYSSVQGLINTGTVWCLHKQHAWRTEITKI